jgi:hypothetical protein
MQSNDEFYRKLIKPIRDSKINNLINSISSDAFSPYDQELNWSERTMPILKLKKNFLAMSKNSLQGLDSFPHMYVMNGNTDSLIALFSRTKTMSFQQGDYSYYKYWHTTAKKACNELTTPEKVEDFVFTWPGYSQGNKKELDFALACNADRLHLDCAYLGLTAPDGINTTSFETVSVSFSKTLSIPYNRISLLFSKNELPEYSLLNRLGYVNLAGVHIANKLIEQLPATYWWDTYSELYKQMCKDKNLTPTDCLLFAYDNNTRVGTAPYWQEYLV